MTADLTRAPTNAREEASSLLRLAGPVILGQAGLFAMGLTDTLMVGRVSSEALASVALGSLYSFMILATGRGLLQALDPVLSQAVGAGDLPALRRGVQRGLVLAALLSLPAALVMLLAEPALVLLRQPDEIVPIASSYAVVSALGAPAFFAFVALRQSLQALHLVRPVVVAVLVANVVNALLNWVLVFGHLGFAPMGAMGSAWATVISRCLMTLVMLALGWSQLGPLLRPRDPAVRRPRPLLRLLGLGAPLGLQHLLEFGTFAAVSLFMGWLGAQELAAHQIALQLASLAFMVPMGLSSAASVRVGLGIGRGDSPGARRAAAISLGCGAAAMAVSAVLFTLSPEALARAFTTDRSTISDAASLIRIAAIFAVFDGLQVVAIGVLRAVGDTRMPMVLNVVGFWLIGIPASLLLAFPGGLGAEGLWLGLVVGLFVVALLLLLRVRHRLAGVLTRLQVEDEPLGLA